jgi:hypothetical protein
MSEVSPGNPNYEDTLQRIVSIIQQNQADLAEIDQASEISFRLWLDKVVQEVSQTIGIVLGKAQAFVADVLTSLANAGTTFRTAYADAYGKSRRIERK